MALYRRQYQFRGTKIGGQSFAYLGPYTLVPSMRLFCDSYVKFLDDYPSWAYPGVYQLSTGTRISSVFISWHVMGLTITCQ